MKYTFLCFTFCFLYSCITFAQDSIAPTFEEVISLHSVSSPEISPDGRHVVFQKNTVDWKENRYDTEIWISKNGEPAFQITNNPKSSSSRAKWSPDGKWIAYLSNHNDHTQIQVMRVAGGTSFQLTHTPSNINQFAWSPDGSKIAFLQTEDKSKSDKSRERKYGAFAIEDEEYELSQLWVIQFNPDHLVQTPLPHQLEDSVYTSKNEAQLMLDSVDFTISNFKYSPDGRKIAFTHQPDPLINTFFKADISILDVDSKTFKILVSNPSFDRFMDWSPDGRSILYSTALADTTSNYYKNTKLFKIGIDGNNKRQLGKDFDENIYNLHWKKQGIFGVAWQKTQRPIIMIDPSEGRVNLLSGGPARISDFSLSKDGNIIAFTGANDTELTELYISTFPLSVANKITQTTNQLDGWSTAQSEVITWQSKDGTSIEGILHKPQDYDPNQKYPLMVVIHGGPTGISTPHPVPAYVYPMLQWLNKGALILRPNYRGSAGYGEAFRSLNVKNLGVGDAWDVLSGIQYLEDQGIINGEKVAAMGWSQGGYISAFLTTNSNKFKAISVGAGISNWMTYYVNTDIHPFTRQYLKSTPWSDKAIYEKTSPMTNIKNASTPTLIQHGEFDKRVPPANAFELYQGLQDVGTQSKLIIYKGFGHGINKPKERLAATWHNWQWINKYIWNEEVVLPEIDKD